MDYKKLQLDIFPKLTKTDDGQTIKIKEIKKVYFSKNSSTISIQYSYEPDSEKKYITIIEPKQDRTGRRSKGNNYQLQKKSELQPAYKKKLPISVKKYNDILKLCNSGVIPNRYHQEYISMKRNETVEDTIGETDKEDCNEETEN